MKYTFFLGEEVTSLEGLNSELETMVIPAQKYKKFTTEGVCLDRTTVGWQEIWSDSDLHKLRAFIADFEFYDERNKGHGEHGVSDIYVGIKS